MVTKIIKWVSLPVLLVGSLFSSFAANYEFAVSTAIFLGALIVIQRAFWMKDYFYAAGFVAIAVVFSPLTLVFKIFALMGFTCIGVFATVLAVFRAQSAPAEQSHAVGQTY